MDQAKGSLQTLFDKILEKIKKQNANVNDFSDNEKQIICLYYLLILLSSSGLSLFKTNARRDKEAIYNLTLMQLFLAFHPEKKSFEPADLSLEDWQKFFTKQNIEIIARHLCKVFLLYMFDRKPANLLVFDNEQKSKQEFVEADFDDLNFINCLFGKITDNDNKEIFSSKIGSIFFRFLILTDIMPESTYDEFSNCIKRIAKKFTFKQTDIEQLIVDIAQNNKYFNISKDKLVNGIKNKFKDWKDMLEKNLLKEMYKRCQGDNDLRAKFFVERINPFLNAIETTHDTLLNFNEQRISELIELPDRLEEFDKNVEENEKVNKENSKAQSVTIKKQTPIKGRNNNNTSADCNLQDYIPSCIKECFDCA